MTRRFFHVAAAACAAIVCLAANAGEWPAQKPITLVVPLAAGGSTDSTARLLAERLGKEIKQQIIVENRAGAGGNIGAAYVAKANPDGYTLLMATSTIATNVTLYKSMGFDLRKDLIPVSQVALIPNVLVVNNNVPAKTLPEFIDYVQKKKGPITYGSAGNGTASHLSGALFNSMAHADMLHIPYKGGAPANADLIGGQIQAVFAPMVEILPFIDGGKLRPLAVTTKGRSTRLPNVPAVTESLPGFEVTLWNGVFAPANTPQPVVDKLAAGIQKVLQDPAVRKTLADQGSTAVGNKPAEFRKIVDSEIDKWGKLVKLSGASVE
ncbi:tripartite tricarboxylate transporter substrate binding protein [Cupriavidus consociatus]|uniref:tripartite tricarboxylate transporter substrate binding protein n=1 Tax=Cupriavidus consociatus TaxID=2821357 RepID=UPI001AE1CF87|nr:MULTISPECIES: tripartite tricarboxylate transporter substrate binding protein [unclassified Cupriavidus]MBP0622399.1 tripartite tricarboxylate transporter substrate binding protein [Cupriavidus sp. LEh25]MDK2659086.1 tripartite tricarboxylate transporter substrate binding protein [Cupriavidus sp. LEh21]